MRYLFLIPILLFSCTSEEKNTEKVVEEIAPIVYEYISEINEISEHDLFHCCCDKDIKDLVSLLSVKVSYINMNGESEMGELVVNEEIAAEVVDIFREIYQCRFPINKMIPIDSYNCNDDKSMEDNNTSCFNYRLVSGSRKLSDHSFGKAIDINPLFNPFVKRNKVSPENGKMYIDRNLQEEGMIQKNDCVVNAFKSRGWYWGGDWKHSKDYQHFYKY